MEKEYALDGKNIYKKLKKFELNVESIQIPKGFATALIGENGAGKTTLFNCLNEDIDVDGGDFYFVENGKKRKTSPEDSLEAGYQNISSDSCNICSRDNFALYLSGI